MAKIHIHTIYNNIFGYFTKNSLALSQLNRPLLSFNVYMDQFLRQKQSHACDSVIIGG